MKQLSFLDRWEYRLLKKYNADHQPVASFVTVTILIACFAAVIAVFVMQMADVKGVVTDYLPAAFILAALLIAGWKVYKPLMALPLIGTKIAFAAAILLLFGILTPIFIMLSSLVLILALIVLVLWIVLLATGGGGGGRKKKAKIRYSDGREEDAEESGKGILGETYYKGKESGKE
jgi:hypothetical protein